MNTKLIFRRDATVAVSHRHFVRGLEVRAATEGYIGQLEGHAAVFNSDSVEFEGWDRPWVERVAPGAFKRTLTEMPDIFALSQHDSAATLARSPKTLTLSEDERGLKVGISLVDTQLNRDTLALVRSGIIDSMSFGFSPRSTKWEEGKDRDVRTLLDVDLFEVSVVTWPAYPASSIGARSTRLPVEEMEALKLERSKFLNTAGGSPKPETNNHLLRYWERRVRFL